MEEQGTRLILENANGRYSIYSREDVENISDFVDEMVRPLLLAAGWHPNNVNEVLGE